MLNKNNVVQQTRENIKRIRSKKDMYSNIGKFKENYKKNIGISSFITLILLYLFKGSDLELLELCKLYVNEVGILSIFITVLTILLYGLFIHIYMNFPLLDLMNAVSSSNPTASLYEEYMAFYHKILLQSFLLVINHTGFLLMLSMGITSKILLSFMLITNIWLLIYNMVCLNSGIYNMFQLINMKAYKESEEN